MLLSCSSCNSRYLVNSADLKPNGRIVRCAKCNFEWLQEPILGEEEALGSSVSTSIKEENKQSKQEKTQASNLPSTYVKDPKPSKINSILVVLFFVMLIFVFWIVKIEKIEIISYLNYYSQKFYINLQSIISDLAKLIHQIIN